MKTLYEVWQGGHCWSGAFLDVDRAREHAEWRVGNPANSDLAQIVEVTRKVVEEVRR